MEDDEDNRTCAKTGLRLTRSRGQMMWRIALISYGPLRPPVRAMDTEYGVQKWNRYDVEGQRVIYGGTPKAAAYAETLASLRVAEQLSQMKLSDLFSDEGTRGDIIVLDAIAAEWASSNHMQPGSVTREWRDARAVYSLALPEDDGWFVNIGHSDSVSVLNSEFGTELTPRITAGSLRGDERRLTTRIAAWIWDQVLDDGHLPHGIQYRSKHGDDYRCWAVFLRQVGDGKDITSEPTKVVGSSGGEPIAAPYSNPTLSRLCSDFGLSCH